MMFRMPIICLFALVCLLPLYARAAELININTADSALLDTLPGIGPSKAAAILDYRSKNGPFATIEDIQKVSGIGPVTFAHMEKLITVGATSTLSASETVASAQPPVSDASYTHVKAVEPITSPKKNIQAHEQAVIAPAAAVKSVAAGAALPSTVTASIAPVRASGLFSSPWTIGFIGIMALAGAAFIFI